MNSSEDLKSIKIGERVAEDEIEGLKNYFVKTYLWEQIIHNEIDIIFGCKGSGKSALYGYLSTCEYDLMGKGVSLVPAENPRGAIAFKDLAVTPPKSEFEFKSIWKLYFAILLYQKLAEYKSNDSAFKEVVGKLQDSDLIPRSISFGSIIKLVRGYIKRLSPTIEPNVTFNEQSGAIENFGVKISLIEPETKAADKGVISIDKLIELMSKSLQTKGESVWISIDRLDAIFQENFELEATALRTLFQVYIDLKAFHNIRLIIFLRDDIWNKIIEKGFREISHITRISTIDWDENSLFDLIMSRFEQNAKLLTALKLTEKVDLHLRRKEIFNKLFPKQTQTGSEFNFDWFISKIRDGNGLSTPRELIQLINTAIKHEIYLATAGKHLVGSVIGIQSLLEGLKDASETKLDTLVAEYPGLKHHIFRLKGTKVRLTIEELRIIWDLSRKDTSIICNNLVKIGFFRDESEKNELNKFYVPLIFRSALKFPIG